MIGIDSPAQVSASISKPIQTVRDQRTRAIIATGLVIVCVFGWLAFEIPRGILSGTDELLTAERTREMLLTEPWVVHLNFERSFEKPPLQYWLSTLTLSRLHNRTLAVRIWPLLYGCLTAVAVAWFARLVQPDRPWLMPLSVFVLVSCPLFSSESSRALLDIGLTFFTMMTIIFAQLARRRPVWWLGAAAMCVLGSLQKLPEPFVVWIGILVVRLLSAEERRTLRSRWLIASLLLAIVAMAIWPLVQILKYHMPVASVFHEEVVVWLGPTQLGARPYLEVLIGLSTAGGLCGLLAWLSPFVVLFSRTEKPPTAIREVAIVSLAVIALVIVSNFRNVRYLLPILPCLCFLLALVFYRFLAKGGLIRRRAAIALGVLFLTGDVQAKLQIDDRLRSVGNEKRIAEELGALQRPGTQIVLIKAIKPGEDLLYSTFYLFHGNLRFPVTKYTVDQIRADRPKAPLIGACVARDFPVIQELYPKVRVQLRRAQFVCWRVDMP